MATMTKEAIRKMHIRELTNKIVAYAAQIEDFGPTKRTMSNLKLDASELRRLCAIEYKGEN